MANVYASLDAVKSVLGLSNTTYDARILDHLHDASRRIDAFTHRHFWTVTETRYFDSRCRDLVWVDDYLSLSALAADSERDNTFDGETWVEDTDFTAWPQNSYPKIGFWQIPSGNYAWTVYDNYLKATGVWGYGDGLRAAPWDALSATGTVATAGGTTLTLSADGEVEAGHTLLIEDEQMYVSAVTTGSCTVERGVNGTTAAAHSGAAISRARYAAQVEHAVIHLAIGLLARAPKGGYQSERIADYQYTLASESDEEMFLGRALRGLVREVM